MIKIHDIQQAVETSDQMATARETLAQWDEAGARKICIHCRHFEAGPYGDHRCTSPKRRPSLITGKMETSFCNNQRTFSATGFCGPQGLWFEAKEPACAS